MRYKDATAIIRAYFESYGRLACPAGLVISGDDRSADSASLNGHRMSKHADLCLAMRGVTDMQMSVLALRFAGASGVRSYIRYVSSPDQMQSHETLTKQPHPTDPSLTEVTGVFTLGATTSQISKILGLRPHQIDTALASAKETIRRNAERMAILAV